MEFWRVCVTRSAYKRALSVLISRWQTCDPVFQGMAAGSVTPSFTAQLESVGRMDG